MQEFQNKNDYTAIIFNKNGFLCKYTYVNNIFSLTQYLTNSVEFNSWTTVNVYVRRTGRFLVQYRVNSFIDPKPR